MDIEERAYAVTRAVHVVQSFAPHGLLGQHVELGTTDARRELSHLYLDMPFQHQRVDMAHLVGERTEGDGTGDVGGTVKILSTTVEQQQSFGLQGDVSLGSRFIVDDGTMSTIGCNGVERDVLEQRLLGTQTLQCPGDGELCLVGLIGLIRLIGLIGLIGLIEPLQEFHHCDAVFQHRTPKTRLFGGILDGLHALHG